MASAAPARATVVFPGAGVAACFRWSPSAAPGASTPRRSAPHLVSRTTRCLSHLHSVSSPCRSSASSVWRRTCRAAPARSSTADQRPPPPASPTCVFCCHGTCALESLPASPLLAVFRTLPPCAAGSEAGWPCAAVRRGCSAGCGACCSSSVRKRTAVCCHDSCRHWRHVLGLLQPLAAAAGTRSGPRRPLRRACSRCALTGCCVVAHALAGAAAAATTAGRAGGDQQLVACNDRPQNRPLSAPHRPSQR